MIVLTTPDIQALTPIVQQHQALLDERHVAVNPIAIKNNLYILGEDMLADPNFAEVVQAIKDSGYLFYTRDVDPSEYFEVIANM